LQDTSEINVDICEARRYFMKKKRKYVNVKINELGTNSKNKNITDLHRGINECKKGYQPSNNLMKDENGECLQIHATF
jgi:hypothetical protein